ncbi:hypothetical protein OCU04_000934 [Sclerotinia nivalis]|uniref:Uncharacterized protein n=1 Tax=Sclerotinia nivalis TaxID=352851 RepID=A0A9X0DQ97_9HELO|nr:hypothetical protein OCU04_000934 [Sclerotinia nivalis]
MSASHSQSTGGEQPQDISSQISDEHQSRIKIFTKTIAGLSESFLPLSPKERDEHRRLYKDACLRIIDYYRNGNELPAAGKCVFTITGHDGVWRDTVIEMMKIARRLKGFPVSDHFAFQACHNIDTGISKEMGRGYAS